MTHPLYHVVDFETVGAYRLRIRFDDGLERHIDLEPILWGELYGPLRDPAMFRTARLDPEFRTLVWDNGADFDPSILHDWPEHERAWRTMAAQWRSASVHTASA
jgi:hypothetical protein